MAKALYTVVIVKLDKNGEMEQIVVEPETIVARDEQDAVVKMTAKHSHMIDKEVKVLCRPF